MSRTSYRTLQKAIARDDKRGIESRWTYGRKVLADPRKISASGKSLRHGAIEALIAESGDKKLTEREIQYRLQCARAYKSINEIRTAAFGFASWTELREAGFPVTEVDETPAPEDLLDDIQDTDPQEFEQLGLFPPIVKTVPLERSSLRHLVAYAEEMRSMTASYARRDAERTSHLNELCLAVGGDLDVLYPDAIQALNDRAAKANA